MIRVSEIKLSIDENQEKIKIKIAQKLKIKQEDILGMQIYKQSIDARKKEQIFFVYTVDVSIKNEKKFLKIKDKNIGMTPDMVYEAPQKGDQSLSSRPVIVGTGPSGLFCGLLLAELGYKPLLIERGKAVDERVESVEQFWEKGILDVESNVQFGEGGAGTFSDGKLTTQIKDFRCRKVLELFIEAGAPKDIIYKHKPHIGTDILRNVVKNMRKRIIALGGEVQFDTKLTDIYCENNKIKGIQVNSKEKIETEVLVLALGHSARDTFEMVHEVGIEIEQKLFSIGVRIEHPQVVIDESQYGKNFNHEKLGPSEYKLVHKSKNGRGVYTFCMCPGGQVVGAASESMMVVTNGMSEYKRNQVNANSAVLASVIEADFESEHPLAGMYFQRKWERKAFDLGGANYNAPAQRVEDFLENRPSVKGGSVKPSYLPGVKWSNLSECLPAAVFESLGEGISAFGKKIRNFDMADAVVTGIETRSSSPIRILRNEDFESNIAGLYPAGEGAGYAGGIVSAAVDGVKIAEMIIKKYKD